MPLEVEPAFSPPLAPDPKPVGVVAAAPSLDELGLGWRAELALALAPVVASKGDALAEDAAVALAAALALLLTVLFAPEPGSAAKPTEGGSYRNTVYVFLSAVAPTIHCTGEVELRACTKMPPVHMSLASP